MDEDLVTIRHFRSLGEAHVARGLLESAGIPCFLADEHMYNHVRLPEMLGGVRLQVSIADMETAQELLDHATSGSFLLDASQDELPRCPKCASLQVTSDECRNCGARWDEL
ncbi:MAG: DUF2007 domain-containing protein [Candidatus Korobacteraceae bacterium]